MKREVLDLVSDSRRGGLAKRDDLEGVQRGVDWAKNRAAIDDLQPWEEGVMTDILSGAVIARERLVRHGRVEGTAECKMCKTGEIEDREHRMWRCTALEEERGEAGGKMRALLWGDVTLREVYVELSSETARGQIGLEKCIH